MPVSTTVIPISSITNENSSAVIIQDSIPPHSITDNDDDSPISTSKSTKDINIDKDLLMHDVFKHIMNGNFISPIDKPTMKNCLDIGGIWMMEVAS
nr:1448_t:CDS:2 [Entrophospora candida]